MRPVLLIAKNFAREQRWPLFFLLLWVLGWATFGVFADPRSGPEDALMIFRQLAVYSVTFGVFFGSSAIQADQRSRRILSVLSKEFPRRQYIFGLLAEIAPSWAFCLCMDSQPVGFWDASDSAKAQCGSEYWRCGPPAC